MRAAKRFSSWTLLLLGIALCGWALATALILHFRAERNRVPEEGAATPIEATPSRIDLAYRALAETPEFAGAAIAFCLLDEEGEVLFASDLARTALTPASSLKTVTTAAALEILGPEFVFETKLATTAALGEDGFVEGDIVIVGGGDPTLSREDLVEMAGAAIKAGLTGVAGRVVVDTSIFPANPVSDHWVWGDVGNGYGAGAFGLNLEHNRVAIRFEPGAEEGAPAAVSGHGLVPAGVTWKNFVVTGPAGSGDGVVVYSEPFGRRLTLRGTVPLGESGFTVSAANPDPPACAIEIVQRALVAGGVRFSDRIGPFPDRIQATLATHRSGPLPAIVDHIHRVSDNLEAQSVFLTIGRVKQMEPATAIREFWESAGVQFEGLRLIDGSGLARANMIRPIDLARVVHAAKRAASGDRFYQSLSEYLDGDVRAKLGGMSGVNTQAGFLRTTSGRELAFAFMANGLPPDGGIWASIRTFLEEVRAAIQ